MTYLGHLHYVKVIFALNWNISYCDFGYYDGFFRSSEEDRNMCTTKNEVCLVHVSLQLSVKHPQSRRHSKILRGICTITYNIPLPVVTLGKYSFVSGWLSQNPALLLSHPPLRNQPVFGLLLCLCFLPPPVLTV